ncbi:hypothetical protein M0Q50_10790 [bacterium]|jgi:hypothetical protein|nr:hypothetical protein [bacterium]
MKSASCSIKLLESAYIGLGVRMTSDSKTVKFENIPVKNVKIIKYNEIGFKLEHPNWPKSVWVKFEQLPLTNLIIKNGVIEDEITFVENIVSHQMELIKTDMLDYIELLDLREREKTKNFVTLNQIKSGDIVRSALCESGLPMIYLGSWYTKSLNIHNYWYNTYSNSNKITCTLNNNSPKKAFFLIKKDNDLYKLKMYSITSKVITTLENLNENLEYWSNDEYNENIVWNYIIKKDYNLQRYFLIPKNIKFDINDIDPKYQIENFDSFYIDIVFISKTKENIDDLTIKLCKEKFNINFKLEGK